MNPSQNPPTGHGPDPNTTRKSFLFYFNWYTDARKGLTDTQLAEFVLLVIQYAAEGTLPDGNTTPVVATMFGLVRPAIDADLKKYDAIVIENRSRGEKSAEKRRSPIRKITLEKVANDDVTPSDVDVVDNQGQQCLEPIIDNRELIIDNRNEVKEKKEEEAPRGALAPREEVEAYWREHHYKSDINEFLDYYSRRHWITSRGIPIRSWKRAAIMWEDKFCRDVLPVRRREARAQAAVEAQTRHTQQAAQAAAQRRFEHERQDAERERNATRCVTPEVGRRMLQQALTLANGDETRAMELMRQAPDNPELFKRLNSPLALNRHL